MIEPPEVIVPDIGQENAITFSVETNEVSTFVSFACFAPLSTSLYLADS